MSTLLQTALAYIDPGSGSLVLQMLIAGALGTLAFFRNSVSRFFGFFRRSKPKDKDDSPTNL